MKSIYFKLLLFLNLILVFVVITTGIKYKLVAAGSDEKKERVSRETKLQIEKLFYGEKLENIGLFIREEAEKGHFNGNVLVAWKGECVFNASFGYADLIKQTKLENDDVFQLASVSKQFTAMGVMILKEQGLLHYDDSVNQYIKEFPYEGITIRMLLNHTSGLANYMWLVENYWKGEDIPGNDDIIKLMAKQKLPLFFKPGTRFDYSNTGYIILATIIERVSGVGYAGFIQKNIFDPLHMHHSFVYGKGHGKTTKSRLAGYSIRGKRYRLIPETVNDGAVGDKGVYSTTGDLFKWDKALYDSVLVSGETIKEAVSGFKIREKYDIPYGFGFRILQNNNKKVVYHHGRWNGFRTSLLRYVEDTNTIIVLNHTSSLLNGKLVNGIQKIMNDTISNISTYELVTSVLDKGLGHVLEEYARMDTVPEFSLDTLKLVQTSMILQDKNYDVAAEKILLIKHLYTTGKWGDFIRNKDKVQWLSVYDK